MNSVFAELVLYRPLRRHKYLLPYNDNGYVRPSIEILFKILYSSDSMKSVFRKRNGETITKNFENHLTGKHQVSTTSLRVIATAANLPLDMVINARKSESGIFGMLEDVFLSSEEITRTTFERASLVICPVCKGNALDDTDTWWSTTCPQIPLENARFVERFLKVFMGSTMFVRVYNIFADEPIDDANIAQWFNDQQRPMRHWFDELLKAKHIDTFTKLEKHMLEKDDSVQFTARQIRYWANGVYKMPYECETKLIATLDIHQQRQLRYHGALARATEFLMDFLCASHPSGWDESEAQKIIYMRFTLLEEKLRFAINHKYPKVALTQGIHE